MQGGRWVKYLAYLSIHTLCMGSNKTELKFSQNYMPDLAYDQWY